MGTLNNRQIERQDTVDNAIFALLRDLNPSDKELEWDIEVIAEVRETIQAHLERELGVTEMEFYPYTELSES
jgi:hypothetical protein